MIMWLMVKQIINQFHKSHLLGSCFFYSHHDPNNSPTASPEVFPQPGQDRLSDLVRTLGL